VFAKQQLQEGVKVFSPHHVFMRKYLVIWRRYCCFANAVREWEILW